MRVAVPDAGPRPFPPVLPLRLFLLNQSTCGYKLPWTCRRIKFQASHMLQLLTNYATCTQEK
ncbi:hypothetical protein M5D96_006724 [Drosophila gunungcola]|uniref:Uncharacterized protein n=1 Tax=Drosophila gunungcola TaxID=103775 RepID=A0A9P9YPM6_9MUSC|nr:hypothetical protein M5D96_006724 [Drosophila gunungcola]